ncbi:hypothetical protein BTJ68_00076 [Hortaea werneckii EXF-2000]|uniref:K Homology domain-containing protein n=1 Tax=Hortaea werneckii EXF-2000 TaxID=1157616 RepID=A0A1Z5TVF7_HORWE|nr:hypothetical protein BTJ68_00076 [Hortaea werneckii EXF-2000]
MQVAKWDTQTPCVGIKSNLNERHLARTAWHTACQASQPHKDLELPPLWRTVLPTPRVRHMSALVHSNRKLTATVHHSPVHMLDSHSNRCKQIFIPNDMVGAIIGKGGAKINEIRQLSGSVIKINEPQDNSNERLVTITGTQECNQMALYMLYSRLGESSKNSNAVMPR